MGFKKGLFKFISFKLLNNLMVLFKLLTKTTIEDYNNERIFKIMVIMQSSINTYFSMVKDYNLFNIDDLTKFEIEILGFKRYKNKEDYYLIPFGFLDIIPSDVEIINVDNNMVINIEERKDLMEKSLMLKTNVDKILNKELSTDSMISNYAIKFNR